MTLAEETARFLARKSGFAFEGGTSGSVFFGYMPETPVRAICVTQVGDEMLQIRIRADDDAAWPLETAQTVRAILRDMRGQLLTQGGRYALRCDVLEGFALDGITGDTSHSYSAKVRVLCA